MTKKIEKKNLALVDEQSLWAALEPIAHAAFDFWKSFFLLKRGPSNDQDLTAADIKIFRTIIRCVSWVESKHGTAGANFPAADPMQCGNPNDAWWKAINKPPGTTEDRFIDSTGKGYWAADLPGVMDGTAGFPANCKLKGLTTPKNGHRDPNFNRHMSFYWGVVYLIQKINTGVSGGKTYKCGDCSKARMINGAAAYNGGGDPNYRTKIFDAWKLITGESAFMDSDACLSDECYESMSSGSSYSFDATADALDAEVLIQAGHYKHNPWDDRTGAATKYGKEIDWTPVVRDSAVALLEDAGISVISTDASIKTRQGDPPSAFRRFKVKTAVFVHFDGSKSGTAGASVGYNDDSDKPAATEWKNLYARYWDFKWMEDNYTDNLRYYYGYSHSITSDAEMVIEFGDLSNEAQALWLKPRLKILGHILAHFLASRVGKGDLIPPPPDVDLVM